MHNRNIVRALYNRLLALYPHAFKERFRESMEQTFNDLYHERQQTGKGRLGFVLWTFAETATGIIKEHVIQTKVDRKLNMSENRSNYLSSPKETTMNTRQSDIVRSLSEALNLMIDTVSSGQFGFDHAASEYAKQADGELALAFQDYWQAIKTGAESLRDPSTQARPNLENVRRDAFLALADRINVPEVTTFVQGMIEAQAARTNVLEALTSQAEKLKNA